MCVTGSDSEIKTIFLWQSAEDEWSHSLRKEADLWSGATAADASVFIVRRQLVWICKTLCWPMPLYLLACYSEDRTLPWSVYKFSLSSRKILWQSNKDKEGAEVLLPLLWNQKLKIPFSCFKKWKHTLKIKWEEGLDDCSANMDICKQHLAVTKSFDLKQSLKKIDIGIEFRLITWLPSHHCYTGAWL